MNKMKRVTQIGRVEAGHRVEVVFPELMEGQLVEVSVTYDEEYSFDSPDIMCFLSAREFDNYLSHGSVSIAPTSCVSYLRFPSDHARIRIGIRTNDSLSKTKTHGIGEMQFTLLPLQFQSVLQY